MSLLADSRLDDILRAHNPWWATGALPRSARYTQPRGADAFLAATGRPALLAGPRRCGKTATLFRRIDGHLRAEGRPREVAYLPLDHPLLRLVPPAQLVDRVVKAMEPKGRPLVLLDGVQALPQWPERFLEIVTTRPHPLFVGAASVAPGLADPAFDVVPVTPLSFREFCALKGVPDLGAPPLDPFAPVLPERADPAEDVLFHRVLDPLLADYLVRGGLFETALAPDPAAAHEFVRREVVARAVYQDLPAVVGVDKVAELERVLLAALLQGGGPVVLEAFADALEIDAGTVGRYLEHLGRAFLLTELRNFAAAATDRSRPRVHAADPSLPNALFERGAAVLARPDERRGLLAGAVVAHLQQVARERGFDLAYFREGDLEAEVVLVGPDGAIPVLLVDREEAGEEEAALAEKVLRRTQARTAFVLSRAGPRMRAPLTFFETVVHLPASYFLYALAGGGSLSS